MLTSFRSYADEGWCQLSMCKIDHADAALRGNRASINARRCVSVQRAAVTKKVVSVNVEDRALGRRSCIRPLGRLHVVERSPHIAIRPGFARRRGRDSCEGPSEFRALAEDRLSVDPPEDKPGEVAGCSRFLTTMPSGRSQRSLGQTFLNGNDRAVRRIHSVCRESVLYR